MSSRSNADDVVISVAVNDSFIMFPWHPAGIKGT